MFTRIINRSLRDLVAMLRGQVLAIILVFCCHLALQAQKAQRPGLLISKNGRFFTDEKGKPFFWLGDTGWLLFARLNREEAAYYLEDRRQKGFNVIQVMLLHELTVANCYGEAALEGGSLLQPRVTAGNDPGNPGEYDYWDHVEYIVDLAATKGIYLALVPVWGTAVKQGKVSPEQAESYARFLAKRFQKNWNIIWLNGGDIRGSDSPEVWNRIGETLRRQDRSHLISFHPFGRTSSGEWFHQAAWLDFNLFQSGHRNYSQDTAGLDHRFGEDNYRYVAVDYSRRPVKPCLDGEPSYEDIPQGLHDLTQPRWTDADVRRYAYWEVFAGGAGFTYGNNSVMQMYHAGDPKPAYGANRDWKLALQDSGAAQMIWLKRLMSSSSYFDRVPAQDLLSNDTGSRYNYVAVTREKNRVLCYDYTGRSFSLRLSVILGKKVKASWYSPRDGSRIAIGELLNQGTRLFDPPGEPSEGNDWVLILEKTGGAN